MTTHTMKSGIVSTRGNRYSQVYCTQYWWSRCHILKLKSEAQKYLSMLFKRDGVPPKIVVDNSKEQSLGKFASECFEADCHLINTDHYSP